MSDEIMGYLNQLAGGELDECLDLGKVASEALAHHLARMQADTFAVPVIVDGATYIVSVTKSAKGVQ